ncbi:MAG TPA: cytochrome b [Candidatus Cybelea sp.]|nr:cytochrome b [Candidatus Cybelea sp.]
MTLAFKSTGERYGIVAQTLHWLTAILVLWAYVVSPGGPEARVYLPARDAERVLHESLGLAILILVALRLIWRQVDRRPEPVEMPKWMELGSALAHGLLYLLLFAVPLTAIFGAWAEAHPIVTYYTGAVPPPFAELHDLGLTVSALHKWLGDAIMWLAGFHAAAGLFHHFLLRDRVLTAMLPRLK